jgi:hypothetical protein
MKVKNISGGTLTFNAGNRTYSIANSATQTVDDTMECLNDVIALAKKGCLELVSPPPSAHYSGSPAAYGYADVDLATGLVDTYTFIAGGQVFEFDGDNSLEDATATRVVWSATMATSAANLKAAINNNSVLSDMGLVADDIVTISGGKAKLIVKATGDTPIDEFDLDQTGVGITITEVAASDGSGYRTSTKVITAAGSTLLVDTGLQTIHDALILVRDSSGDRRAWAGTAIIGGGFLYLSGGSQATAMTNGDVVSIVAIGK